MTEKQMSLIKTWLHKKITEEIAASNELADLSVEDYEDFVKDLPDDDTELLRYVMFG